MSVVLIGDDRFVRRAPERLHGLLATRAPTDLESLIAALGNEVDVIVGEARLAYADDETPRLVSTAGVIEVGDDDDALMALEAASAPSEWRESSADEPCDRRFGVVREGSLLAVSTVSVWDDALGHVGVFTAAHARGLGLAGEVGSAAVDTAPARGCIPQSARPHRQRRASARVAVKLGFEPLGRQMTVRVGRADG